MVVDQMQIIQTANNIPPMKTSEFKMLVWGNTVKGAKVYPLTRTDENYVQQKFEEHLHNVMHRAGEQNDEQF